MSLLIQMTIILAVALLLVPLTKRCNLPTLLGYVLTGLLLGPHVLNVIPNSFELHQLQHVGILLLMFLIGLELRPQRLSQLKTADFHLTGYTMLGSASLGFALCYWLLKIDLLSSISIAAALSVVSFSLLSQQLQLKHKHVYAAEQSIFKLGLVHALFAMLLLAILPLLASQTAPQQQLAYVASFVAALSGLFLLNRYVLRPVFHLLAKTGTHELLLGSAVFTASLVFIVLDALGLHQVLAAFLAGFLISDSLFRPQLQQSIEPCKGIIFALFFIGLGLILPLPVLLEQPLVIVLGAVGLIAVKFLLYLFCARYFKYNWQHSHFIAAHFAQAGEFSFVLLYLALSLKLIATDVLEPFLLILLLVLFANPLLLRLTNSLIDYIKHRKSRSLEPTSNEESTTDTAPLLILGFGRFGQIIGRVAHVAGIRFHAIDNTPITQNLLPDSAGKIFNLDATQPINLQQVGIEHAKLVVVAIDDVEDNMNIVRYLQLHYPQLKLLVRARDRHHAHLLTDLNITQIYKENYGSALELAQSSLMYLGLDQDTAHTQIQAFREHDEQLQQTQQQIEYDEIKLYQTHNLAIDELAYLFSQDLLWKNLQQKDTDQVASNNIDVTVNEAN